MSRLTKVEISYKTVVFTVLFLIFLWFLYLVRVIIIEFFVALLIMTILNPLVTRLSKYKIPRALSIFVSYVIFIGLIALAIAGVVPPLVEQTSGFINRLPNYVNMLGFLGPLTDAFIGELLSAIGNLSGQVARASVSLLSNFIGIMTVLTFAFYLLLARDKLDDQLGAFLGDDKRRKVSKVINQLEKKLGGWARGQLILMTIIGFSTFIGISLLGIPFALPLAILAGILEIVPYIGPIIAAVPIIVIGFSISPFMGFAAFALAFLIQQLENYILVPKVMEKSVGVSPIIILLSLAIGFRIAGVVGILISVPVVITSQIILKQHFSS